MPNIRLLLVAVATTLLVAASSAHAVTYSVHAYDANQHAVWIPSLGQTHLLLDAGSTLTVESDYWELDGTLTSADDGSTYDLFVRFDSVLDGPAFQALTGSDDGRIKGASWGQLAGDWAFAESVTGTLDVLSGTYTGYSYEISRYAGNNDYYAQFGTCLNDKNCDKGLSTWIDLTETDSKGQLTGLVRRGDINASVDAVPEPSAALVFAIGTLVFGGAIRSRTR
jgi:hypothetical protein